MDEINDFFDFSKDFKRIPLPKNLQRNAARAVKGEAGDFKPLKREYEDAESTVNDRRKFVSTDAFPESSHGSTTYDDEYMDELDDEIVDDEPIESVDDAVYDKYHFDLQRDQTLPIHDFKNEVVSMIRSNPVVVLQGDTGCGKTTQVPQYILDDAYRRRQFCKIICTQPRRIAAISIARRVSAERKWEEGTVVGYQVGLHASISPDTRLLYCTTGVLLQKLVREKTLTSYTHIILDEVHERDQDMDFLLVIVRRLLATNSRHVKVILMSATIDAQEFANYFQIRKNPAPVLSVDTRRLYQIREYYLNDLDSLNPDNIQVSYEDPTVPSQLYSLIIKLIVVINNMEKQEVEHTPELAGIQASILIFLPGINEINEMCKTIDEFHKQDQILLKINAVRLHSLISPEEQGKIFHRAPAGFRKVILATNIAESSITVPDVKYVIDSCLTKILVTDTSTNFSCLQLHWASRANCRQRAGRAGRVMNGRVYRLVPKMFYENYLEEFGMPEMLRCPLENVVLKAKLLDMGAPATILRLAMSPPNLCDIQNTILALKEVGALYKYIGETYSAFDGDITFMGRVMATLPLDIRLTRLIILGSMFNALEDTIIIAAGLSVRSIFKYNCDKNNEEAQAYIQKMRWADGSGSDLFAILRAYKIWASLREQNLNVGNDSESAWAHRYQIQLRSIREMHLLVTELKERLEKHGIKEQTSLHRSLWIDREKAIILKIVIAGAFYPNYFIRSTRNEVNRERNSFHTLNGNDPCSTVYFTGFNPRFLGQLYMRPIKDFFKIMQINPKNIEVRFQPGSERVYIKFLGDKEEIEENMHVVVPGLVQWEVYKAVRMRALNTRQTVRVMDPRTAMKYIKQQGIGSIFDGVWHPPKVEIKHPELILLPSVFLKQQRGYITHIEHCGKFYFQPLSEQERLREIHEVLNSHEEVKKKFESPSVIAKGMIVSAPFEDVYQRAKVVKVITSSRQHLQFEVYFIDYGNHAIVNFENLRQMTNASQYIVDIPPRIYECRLAGVQPSVVRSPITEWCSDAMEFMREITDASRVTEIEVYSVVDSIVNVILKMPNDTLNDTLVAKGYARKSDESYMSKMDHDLRIRKQSVASRFLEEDRYKQNDEYWRSIRTESDIEIDLPPRELCMKNIQLRGPYSPLESKIYSAMRVGTWKSVIIERDSVNNVLLDIDPQDAHERLLVAAGITESFDGKTLTARATSQMPNVHGFPALMTLLFCPTMQIKRNATKSKYVSLIAGLGYDEETYAPLYEEHDIVLNLDADLLKDDLELINQMRYTMDTILQTQLGEERPSISAQVRNELSTRLKTLTTRLLNKTRKYIEIHIDGKDNAWQPVDSADATGLTIVYGKRSIFPMHNALSLMEEKFDHIHALAVHCQELHRLRQFDCTIRPIMCKLCNQNLENIVELRMHLLSQLHCDREQQIRFKPQAD